MCSLSRDFEWFKHANIPWRWAEQVICKRSEVLSLPSEVLRVPAVLYNSQFLATGASEVRPRLLYSFVNAHICVCAFYLLWGFTVTTSACLHMCLWSHGTVYAVSKKSLPCAHWSVLSSSLLPPLLVTTSVCCWHLWQPEDKEYTSRKQWVAFVNIFFLTFCSPTQTQCCKIWRIKPFLRLPIRSGQIQNEYPDSLCGLFRSARENQPAITSTKSDWNVSMATKSWCNDIWIKGTLFLLLLFCMFSLQETIEKLKSLHVFCLHRLYCYCTVYQESILSLPLICQQHRAHQESWIHLLVYFIDYFISDLNLICLSNQMLPWGLSFKERKQTDCFLNSVI